MSDEESGPNMMDELLGGEASKQRILVTNKTAREKEQLRFQKVRRPGGWRRFLKPLLSNLRVLSRTVGLGLALRAKHPHHHHSTTVCLIFSIFFFI